MKGLFFVQLACAMGSVGCLAAELEAAEFMPVTLATEKAKTALADYVARPDTNYGWKKRRSDKIGVTEYVELTLTSQSWRGQLWQHQLYILKPSTMDPQAKHGFLLIEGGSWREGLAAPAAANEELPGDAHVFAFAAEQMRTPLAVLLQVPQQPLFDGLHEDALIAYTFEEFLRTGEADWPLLLPMVKSAVRGLDAVHEFALQEWKLDLESFTLSGASKRGWTTWLTAAVDDRVTALAPMVIDMLNMEPQLKHQKASWGRFSEEIHDYTDRDLPKFLASEAGASLRLIVDPYSYRRDLEQPKLLLLGTNDRYWTLDALNLYWDDLAGEKYITYVPNNGHSLKDVNRLVGSLNALHQRAASGAKLPKLDWKYTNVAAGSNLRLTCDTPPAEVLVWTARSDTRDFRNARWTSTPCGKQGEAFACELVTPAQGCAALFCEAKFTGDSLPYYFSTNVRIVGKSPAEAAPK